MSAKFLSAILGPEMAAPILWTPGKNAVFLQENIHVHKIPRFGGGGGDFGFGFGGGGGSADFIFMGVGIFSVAPPLQSLAVKKNFFLCKFWAGEIF